MSTKQYFTPTEEQQLILDSFQNHEVIKINAVAGSGKSSTLRLLAESNPVKSLYICFNKQNAVLAQQSFPPHTECRTVHSLAYATFGKLLAHKITYKDSYYVNRGRTPKEIVNLYSISDYRKNKVLVSSIQIALFAKKTVEVFQNTAYDKVTLDCIPKDIVERLITLKDSAKTEVLSLVLRYAKKLWLDKVDPHSKVKADHDTYQKLFQLSSPKLDFDIIYLDEAQDSSPVVLDIISKQTKAKKVYVGDSYQSIYAFRQAVNAMDMIEAPTFLLSKSFRYGDEIAKIATKIIRDKINVQGLETIKSVVNTFDEKKYTMVFRTNSCLLEHAVNLISQGVSIKCEIDPKKFQSLIYSTYYLKKGELNKIKDDEVSVYGNFEEMLEDSKNNPESKRLVNIVLTGKMFEYNKALDQLIKTKENKKFDVLLTTAHKSKGMEWDNVKIAEDFKIDVITADVDSAEYNQQEVNLFYVACTRSIKKLELPQEYVDYLECTKKED